MYKLYLLGFLIALGMAIDTRTVLTEVD
jgi:hypothetical protein